MNKKNINILICAIIFFIIAIAILIFAKNQKSVKSTDNKANNTSQTQVLPSENKIKELNFYDSNDNKYTLNDYSDKPIAILFWRSDAENVLDYISLFEKYYNDYSEKINLLVINTNEPDNDIIDHVNNANFKIPMYFDKDNTAIEEYQFEKLPYFVFIELDGTISNEKEEKITEDSLLANFDLIAQNY